MSVLFAYRSSGPSLASSRDLLREGLVDTDIEEDAGLQEVKYPLIDFDEVDCGPPQEGNLAVAEAGTVKPSGASFDDLGNWNAACSVGGRTITGPSKFRENWNGAIVGRVDHVRQRLMIETYHGKETCEDYKGKYIQRGAIAT